MTIIFRTIDECIKQCQVLGATDIKVKGNKVVGKIGRKIICTCLVK